MCDYEQPRAGKYKVRCDFLAWVLEESGTRYKSETYKATVGVLRCHGNAYIEMCAEITSFVRRMNIPFNLVPSVVSFYFFFAYLSW